MKLSTKQSKLAQTLIEELQFMLSFLFPCNKTGQQLQNENNISCESCKILFDCIDYYSSSPNQNGKTLHFNTFLHHRDRMGRPEKRSKK